MRNAVFDCIYGRKSVRAYTDERVPKEVIEELLDAGVHAASGVNVQGLRFSVVTDKAKIKEYADKGRTLRLEHMRKIGFPNEHFEAMLSNPKTDIFHGAPAVIFIFSEKICVTPLEDASLAVSNIMLAAHSIGLGTCWIGLADSLSDDPDFMKETGAEGLDLRATVILGYPKNQSPPVPKKEPVILRWID